TFQNTPSRGGVLPCAIPALTKSGAIVNSGCGSAERNTCAFAGRASASISSTTVMQPLRIDPRQRGEATRAQGSHLELDRQRQRVLIGGACRVQLPLGHVHIAEEKKTPCFVSTLSALARHLHAPPS